MLIYNAVANKRYLQALQKVGSNVLMSYAYKKEFAYEIFKDLRKRGYKVMIDSGAFSVAQIGRVIDFDEYCEYVKKNQSKVDYFIALDVLDNCDKSVEQYNEMRNKGLDILPVFHYGEPMEVLEEYLSKTDYVCLGAIARGGKKEKYKWLDRIWSKVMYKYPEKKIHLLGITAVDILERYPAYSCDSASGVLTASYGTSVNEEGRAIHYSNISQKSSLKMKVLASKIASAAISKTDKAVARLLKTVHYYKEQAKRLTDIWTARKITWQN